MCGMSRVGVTGAAVRGARRGALSPRPSDVGDDTVYLSCEKLRAVKTRPEPRRGESHHFATTLSFGLCSLSRARAASALRR